MKKYLILLPLVVLASGCVQQTGPDYTNQLQQLTNSIQQVNQKVDTLDQKVVGLENNLAPGNESTPTAKWKVYSNDMFNFSISYPADWIRSWENIVSGNTFYIPFGKKNAQEASWVIIAHPSKTTSIEKLISAIGDQWTTGRREQRNSVIIDGISATKVVVTDTGTRTGGPEAFPEWYAEEIFFEKDDYIFQISNGAIKDDNFKQFYESMHFRK